MLTPRIVARVRERHDDPVVLALVEAWERDHASPVPLRVLPPADLEAAIGVLLDAIAQGQLGRRPMRALKAALAHNATVRWTQVGASALLGISRGTLQLWLTSVESSSPAQPSSGVPS